MTIFDRLVDEAWPATHREAADGWWLRHAGGVTKRANSVLTCDEPSDPVRAIEAVESFYAERGLPVVFSVSPGSRPAHLDGLLAARGYDVVDPTLIMTTDLTSGASGPAPAPVMERAGTPATEPGPRPRPGPVVLEDRPSQEWLDLWWSVDGRQASDLSHAERIVTGVPARYATLDASVGRSVLQGDWLGIYCMAVAPESRRKGLARAVLHALLDDGLRHGARRAYLCVTERNTGARALYEQAGFKVAGGYHNRILPAAPVVSP